MVFECWLFFTCFFVKCLDKFCQVFCFKIVIGSLVSDGQTPFLEKDWLWCDV
ncbi:hypothetical protein ALO38_200026 [Pseudomonas coronafaciens pv. zizaniae]|nr:hypothetical protein ALO38_200026 [Pseudomonas coronafaciens pv. zizaniae]